MIALLDGEVVSKGLDRAVVLAGGIGMEFFASPATLGALNVGEESRIFTYLVVREDALSLYGFSTPEERRTFATLMQVKGIGPKLGLAALSVLSPADLAQAVANRDLSTLQKIPGVGKKSAERMVIEIGDKLGAVPLSTSESRALPRDGFNPDTVVEALTNLGWNQAQATEAVGAIDAKDAPGALREALKFLGSKR